MSVEAHQPAASSLDRGHVGPQVRREDATRLYPPRRALCQVSGSLAVYGHRRGPAPLSGSSDRKRVQPPSVNSSAVALRFLFTVTLGRANLATQLARVHYPRRLPRVLSPEEVGRLLEAAPGPGLKYKAALSVAYGAGLRASEVVSLKVSDIDSKRMLIRVEQGKGRKDRHAMLSPQLLEVLRAWWRQCRRRAGCSRGAIRSCPLRRGSSTAPATWRLSRPARHLGLSAYSAAQLRNPSSGEPYRRACHPGSARTCKLDTTARYAQVATNLLRSVTSPLDHLTLTKEGPPA